MSSISFLFVGEGSSDDSLVRPLERLCILCGAEEAVGTAVDWAQFSRSPPRAIAARVRAALEIASSVNLVVVHRDADSRDSGPRLAEIEKALTPLKSEVPGIPVVPVQETEAWLLLDESEIRRVAENPRGRMDLDLPSDVEALADPKAFLKEALVKASGYRGRRLDKFKRSFPHHRRLLLERLDPEGLVSTLHAWKALRQRLEAVIQNR